MHQPLPHQIAYLFRNLDSRFASQSMLEININSNKWINSTFKMSFNKRSLKWLNLLKLVPLTSQCLTCVLLKKYIYWYVTFNFLPALFYVGRSGIKYKQVIAPLLHQIYSSYWSHMKALGIFFKWVYGSLIYDKKWLSGRPKCTMTLVNAGTTQAKKQEGKQQYWSDVKTWSATVSQTVTWLFLRVGQAIIPHLKQESLSYLPKKFF